MPWSVADWTVYPNDGQLWWWADFDQLPSEFGASWATSTLESHGIKLLPVTLRRDVLSGLTVMEGPSGELARLVAPSGYSPSNWSSQAEMVLSQWEQVQSWEEWLGEIDPPQVFLRVRLGSINAKAAYDINEEAWAEAQALAMETAMAEVGESGEMMMMGGSCVITNEAEPFKIVNIVRETNGGVTITWESCSDHIYGVFSAGDLTTNTLWIGQAAMWGGDGTTSWTDSTTTGVTNRFYKVVRMPPDGDFDGDGMPNGWEVDHGLNPLDMSDASGNPDSDCFNNLSEYQNATDPLTSDPATTITLGVVYLGPTTNTASTPSPLATLHSFIGGSEGSDPLGGLVPSNGTDGNFYGATGLGGTNDWGTVFRITSQGTLTTLWQFSGGVDGGYPTPPVPSSGADSNFYGTTSYGGDASGDGTFYRLTPQGTLTTLHQFSGTPEATWPLSLVRGANGSFYGTSEYGGTTDYDPYLDTYGYGTVFMISTQGVLTTLYRFAGGSDGAWPQAGLVPGSDGYFYGTTSGEFTGGNGAVFKISSAGSFTALYQFTGGTNGALPLARLVQGSDSNFYGTTYAGGTNDWGTVFRITPQGTLTTLYQFSGGADGGAPSAGLVQDVNSNFYGTTLLGSLGYGTVFRITPQGTLTTVYQFTGGADGGHPDDTELVWRNGSAQASISNGLYGTASSGGTSANCPGGCGTVYRLLPASYAWSMTGGTIAAGQGLSTIRFTVASPCPVTLSVTATNSLGCFNSGSITVTPTAPFPTANSPITVGQTLNLSVPNVAGAAYSWTGPNGFASTNQNPSITNVQPCGTGQYCVSVLGAGCTSMPNCVSVTITTPQPTSNGPLCAGQTLNLSATNITGATYNWTGPGGFSTNSQNPSISGVTTNATGNYCLAVTVNGCTSATNCTSVTVNPLPTATLSGTNIICNGSSLTIQASLTGLSPWIVTWSDGIITTNGTSSAIRTVSPYHTTNYTVTALSDARCSGGSASGSATVTVTTNTTSSVVVSNEVLIVYNTNVADSVSCKNYYIAHRPGFSNANVLACSCTTTGTDGFESITTANLTNQIINPIISFIQSNTTKSIHYLVLMYGMPSRIRDASFNCTTPSVQFFISRSLSTNVCAPSGAVYDGSTCPFVATNYPGTTCLVTALNMATLADCTAYIDKVTSMYRGNVIISAEAAGYTNTNYYLDDVEVGYFPYLNQFQAAISNENPNASIIYSSNAVIRTGSNVRGYASWGVHDGIFSSMYPTNNSVVWSGNSKWWLIETIESFNGQRDASLGPGGQQPQGDVEEWFAANAWGGTNYSNTPVGAVSHVEEPGFAINGPTYMSLWEAGYLFSECAWGSKIGSNPFQVIGDPLIRK